MEHNSFIQPAAPEVKAQIVYFSHGGGPLPILGEPSHLAMIEFMRRLPSQLRKPDAIVVISAHWEERVATLLGAARPPMFYDYYGFPEESYQITYPAPGSPELAGRIVDLLTDSNIAAGIDALRGFDHGLFIPLRMMYPDADVPVIQLSLLQGLDAAAHIGLGRALRPLLSENLLIIGSGFSFHNLGAFSMDGTSAADPRNDAFQEWLIAACTGDIARDVRERGLIDWDKAPSARYCHPRSEHLLPLHVCAALAGGPAKVIFDDFILGKRAVAFRWSGQV